MIKRLDTRIPFISIMGFPFKNNSSQKNPRINWKHSKKREINSQHPSPQIQSCSLFSVRLDFLSFFILIKNPFTHQFIFIFEGLFTCYLISMISMQFIRSNIKLKRYMGNMLGTHKKENKLQSKCIANISHV